MCNCYKYQVDVRISRFNCEIVDVYFSVPNLSSAFDILSVFDDNFGVVSVCIDTVEDCSCHVENI